MPSKIDLDIYQGDDFAVGIMVTNPNGTPADISAYTAVAQLRRDFADSDEDIDASFVCVVSSPSISISLHHDITRFLNGSYLWDLQLVGASGEVITIAAGKARVTQEVTRLAG